MNPRPTMRDIAEKAGCHYSTVSLALRNHPRIAAETRERVQRAAEELGYRPDPMLAALNAYRVMKQPPRQSSVLAWLTNYPTRDHWRDVSCECIYHQGAQRRAEERGYRLEHLWMAEPGITDRRMSDILRNRGIEGLLLAPQQHPGPLGLDWADFSAVTIGYTVLRPKLHNVFHHDYRIMTALLEELGRRDYRRPGLVELREHELRVDHQWLASYLVHQRAQPVRPHLPPLILDGWDEKIFLRWVERHEPDAVVSKLPEVAAALKKEGYRFPADIGVALHSMVEQDAPNVCSGMLKHPLQVGQMAVDLLVDMIHRNEKGVPVLPQQLLIDGSWHEGSTLRPRAGVHARAS